MSVVINCRLATCRNRVEGDNEGAAWTAAVYAGWRDVDGDRFCPLHGEAASVAAKFANSAPTVRIPRRERRDATE